MSHFFKSLVLIGMCSSLVSLKGQTQDIVPVFPQANQTLTLLDLMSGGMGFQWEDPANADNYVIEFRNPTNPISQLTFLEIPVQDSPHFLADTFRGRFLPGDYSWLIRTPDGSRTSGEIPFQINNTGLRPTPGPGPLPPSGDINRSSSIDKPDLYLLAANWKRDLFDSFAADFNLDGHVNQDDLLTLASRFGTFAVPPTAVPEGAIGKPGNIHFFPNDVIGFAELANFKITWEKPQFPEGEFFYEFIVISQFGQEIVSMRFLEETEFSLSSLTQDGTYDVFLRAKTPDGRLSDIVNAQFVIDPTRQVTPTPNFGVISLDFNGDGNEDAGDTRLFIQSFNTFNGDPSFIAGADFNQDGFIDFLDLETYRNNFQTESPVPPAPAWSEIIRPIMEIGQFSQCQDTGFTQNIVIPPFDVELDDSACLFAELFNTQFSFAPVEGAFDYFYTIRIEGEVDPVLQGFTNGLTFFTGFSVLERGTTFLFEIQAVNEALEFSETGEPLRFTIPASSGE